MNDMVLEDKDSEFDMYADDSTMCKNAPTVNEINNLLTELSKPIYNWIDVNCMVLNIPKTESMLMGTVQRLWNAINSFSRGEDEFTITVVNTHTLLCLHVDNSLTWDRHVAFIVFKVRNRLHVLNTTKQILPLQSRIDFYNGLIDYGSCPEYLQGFIKLVDHGRNTHNSNNTNILQVPQTNLKLEEKSFKLRASAHWNGLNINIKNADNIDVFKQRLMKELKCDIYNCDKFCIDLPKYYNE